jgi:hypothetical protein
MSEYGNMSTLSVPLSLYVIHWEVFSFTTEKFIITNIYCSLYLVLFFVF